MRTTTVCLTLLAALTAGCMDEGSMPFEPDATAAAGDHGFGPANSATYEVTITNLTGGQPFTPTLAVVHRQSVGLFEVGQAASLEIQEIAENGNLDPMLDALDGAMHVNDDVVTFGAGPPPVMPGESVTFEIDAERGARYFSFVSMLICTNDGFTGVAGAKLPIQPGDAAEWLSAGYDAGTEINTEDFDDLVPPCDDLTTGDTGTGTGTTDPALAEGGVIHHHGGIDGIDDLVPGIHGWTDPVAMIEVERIL